MTRQLRVAVFAGLFLLSSLAIRAQNAPKPTPPPQPITDQMTNIAYFTLKDGMSSTLTLNNLAPTESKVTVTLFNTEGRAHTLDPITLAPHSVQEVQLEDVAPQDFDSGNIEVTFNGLPMIVTCQVSVFSLKDRVSFESREQDMMDFESTKSAGIVSLPKGADGFLAVTNASKNKLTFQLTAGPLKKTAALLPRETQVIKLNDEERLPATLVRLEHNGLPGDLIATGYVLNLQDGYSSGFAMLDPAINRSKTLAGAHFRVGKPDPSEGFPEDTRFHSPLLLANVSAGPVVAHVSADYTVQDQRTDDENDAKRSAAQPKHAVVKVADVTIAAGDVQRIELSDALADVGPVVEAGVDIAYDADAGSLIGQLTSVDQSGDYSFEVPIKDPAGMTEQMEGVYPWSLDDGNDTVLHLKNTTNQPATGLLLFDYYDNGIFKTYNYPLISLEPYQTIAIDIRKLRDSKERDVQGRLFAADVTHGQAQWHQEEPYSMIGRAEQTNVKTGIAKSFSCMYSCCNTYFQREYLNPSSLAGPAGGSGQFTAEDSGTTCNGLLFGPFADASQNWQSLNTSVATTSTGLVNYVGAGTAQVRADAQDIYYKQSFGTCARQVDYLPVSAQVKVNPPDHVKVVSDNQLYPACPPGSIGPAVYVRQIQLQLVDVNNGNVTVNYSNQESFPAMGYNTCGNGSPNPAPCAPTGPAACQTCANGQYNDTLSVASGGPAGNNFCNSGVNPASGCGFSATSNWGMCSNGLNNSIWTDPRKVLSNQIWIENQAAAWPAGTIFH